MTGVHHRGRLLGHHDREATRRTTASTTTSSSCPTTSGGNWYFRNPNGRSPVYESLHIDTSTVAAGVRGLPGAADYPHFPHHTLIHHYFRDYVDHFGLRDAISFGVGRRPRARRTPEGWDVTLSTGETRDVHRPRRRQRPPLEPRLPDYPGHFDGELLHSHAYISPFEPVEMRGKRVIVVGMGNSAMDIASELSAPWMAVALYVSARRGVWVLPKYRNGQPADKVMAPPDIPKEQALVASRALIRELVGSMSSYGLPEPDHEPLAAHPSVSADFLTKAGLRRHPHAAGDRPTGRIHRAPEPTGRPSRPT